MSASLGLSLHNIYETLAICFPTLADSVRGRLTTERSDQRLAVWSRSCVENARIDLHVRGLENRAIGTTCLVMSNHQSLYDIPVLIHVFGSNLRMIAKKELFGVPIFGPALAAGGFIAIDRSNRRAAIRSLKEARALMANGTPVWISPEGTRSHDGQMLPFKKGAFYLAFESGLPIVPVTLAGTRDVLAARGLRSRPDERVTVTIHPAIDPNTYTSRGKGGRDELMVEVRRVIESAL